MLKKIFNSLSAEKVFLKSLSYLSIVEMFNILFPLLIVPIIINKIGLEGYGKSGLAQSIMLILAVITDWGFNITAIRDIPNLKNQPKQLSAFISTILTTKLLLLLLTLCLYGLVLLFLGIKDFLLFASASTLLIGKTISPNWFYSATERNQYNALAALLTNVIYLLLLYFLLKNSTDYWLVVFFQGIAYIISGLILLALIEYKYLLPIRLNFSSLPKIKTMLGEGKEIFMSNIALQISAYSSTIILSIFISPYLLGIYTLVQKLISVTKVMLTVFFSTMHQRLCNLVADAAYGKVRLLIKRLYVPFLILFLIAMSIIAVVASPVLLMFSGEVTDYSVYIFRISLLVPVVTALNIVPNLLLLSHNYKREFASVTIPSAVLQITLLYLLASKFQIEGAIIALILNELFIVVFLFYKVKQTPILKLYQ